ncbi:alpha/beta fold hydrolase [Aeromicrobium ginsengisoli]|uniref:Alpha/beta hydrolase n=1 Tax=Aeromicrobium ginsengisoli TaxID=363867 RepID=A0A5M4FEM5_9ACTN|nr:alpha/beta hydrolase [Aeromicrobium ginsengisoli]KAA1397576.1 alpha/beta hydrolase [Aeromicrobium ginsengisoli]
MSTPKTLVLPPGVEAVTVETSRGGFAAHAVRTDGAVGHVLLVPGWTGSKEDFTAFLPFLAAAGFDATTYDQRGQYETPGAPDGDYTLDGFAADALAVESAVTPTPSHLLGHSFGGLVAQQAVVADPSAWHSLSLLCTGPGALGETPGRPPLTPLVQAIGAMSLAEIRAHMPRDRSLAPDIAEFLDQRFTSNAPASLKAITQLLIDAPDIIDEVAATGLPFWVGRGADDDAWPHDVQEAMAKRLDTEIHIVEDAAHSPAVENPQGLIDAWLPFLKENT